MIGRPAIADIGTPREFRGHIVALIPGASGPLARLVGERIAGRHREAREFYLNELTLLDEQPLNITVGQTLKVYGHDCRVLARDAEARTSDVISFIDRNPHVEAGKIRFERRWTVPDWHVRTCR